MGGGPVALRKVRSLLDAGAEVTVIAPDLDAGFDELSSSIVIERRGYRTGDLEGAWLANAATNDGDVNALVVADAEAARIWSSAADRPGGGSMASVARRSRGRLTIAASTDGASPALARWLVDDLSARLDERSVALADHLYAHRTAQSDFEDSAADDIAVDDIAAAVREGRVPDALDMIDRADLKRVRP